MKDKKLLKEFCDAYKRRFKCPDTECEVCPYLMFIHSIFKYYKSGCTMSYAIKEFTTKPIKRALAKKMISEIIGLPIELVQSILREGKDEEA